MKGLLFLKNKVILDHFSNCMSLYFKKRKKEIPFLFPFAYLAISVLALILSDTGVPLIPPVVAALPRSSSSRTHDTAVQPTLGNYAGARLPLPPSRWRVWNFPSAASLSRKSHPPATTLRAGAFSKHVRLVAEKPFVLEPAKTHSI